MSERAVMKRRVRGLLRRSWLSTLAALLLAIVPVLALGALVGVTLRPIPAEQAGDAMELSWSLSNPTDLLYQLLFLLSDPLTLLAPVLNWAPFSGVVLGILLLLGLPICVSTCGYFIQFLRGKSPKITQVYSCFSGQYPRAFGGMAYRALWQFVWFVVSFVVPTFLILASVPFVSSLGIELSTQIYIFVGVLLVSLLWYIVFFFLFLNRMLAYCLVPACLAAQPNLPAHRAVRLSRMLMRGSKWRVIALFCSFVHYFLPAILSGLFLWWMSGYGTNVGFSPELQQTLRTVLLWVIMLNQLVWAFVAPYMAASFNAFYIERKREALMDGEVEQEDFSRRARAVKEKKSANKKSKQEPASEDADDVEKE